MQLTVSAQERQKKELPWRQNDCSSPEDAFIKHGLNSRGCAILVTLITSLDLAFWDAFLVNSNKHQKVGGGEGRRKRELKKTNKPTPSNTTEKSMKLPIVPDWERKLVSYWFDLSDLSPLPGAFLTGWMLRLTYLLELTRTAGDHMDCQMVCYNLMPFILSMK